MINNCGKNLRYNSSGPSENGGVSSSKGMFLNRNTEKSSENCQNQLYQKSEKQSKVYSKKANAESRKGLF